MPSRARKVCGEFGELVLQNPDQQELFIVRDLQMTRESPLAD